MTLVMVLNLSQKRSSLPKSLLIVRLQLMLPMPPLLRPLLTPLLPLLLLETFFSSEMASNLVDSKDSKDLDVVLTTDGLRSVTTLNSLLLTPLMTPTPTLSPNT